MLKPIATLAAAGVIGVILTQFLWALVAPFLLFLLGGMLWIGKMVLVAALIWLAWVLFRKLSERGTEA